MQKVVFPALLITAVILSGCRGGLIERPAPKAQAVLQPTGSNSVAGEAVFSELGSKVRVVAEIHGLAPGAHGFHIHENGDCSANDGSSAGGHFNPTGQPHGNPDLAEHHAGDMPQLIADANGNARLVAYLDGVRLGEGAGNIVGRSVVVHAAADDFKSQPAGNSGARLACGVISLK